jgi:hypothetical protein
MRNLRARLARPLGAVWPTAEQDSVLRAIFAPEAEAREAFRLWRAGVDMQGAFDRSVFRLLPLLYRRLHALGVEDEVMARLKGVYRRTWSETHALIHDTVPALTALTKAGIPVMLLKGLPLALCYYRNHGSRPMADLDIAVPATHLPAAIAALGRAGWTPLAPVGVGDRLFRHAVMLRDGAGRELDLHWHMLFEACGDHADAIFWRHAEALEVGGVVAVTPVPTLNLLHNVAHGLRTNIEPPIRWIADALTILRVAEAEIDWDLFLAAAAELGLTARLRLGLSYLAARHGAPIPASVFAALAARRPSFAERLEILAMLRPGAERAPLALRRTALLTAEFLRSARWVPPSRKAALLPAFLRYRLGLRLPRERWRRLRERFARAEG